MVLPIRSRNTGHLSIKVNNVTTFTVTDLHNKIIHNKVKKGSNFLGKEGGCSRRKEQLLQTKLSPGNFSDIIYLTTEAVKVKLKRWDVSNSTAWKTNTQIFIRQGQNHWIRLKERPIICKSWYLYCKGLWSLNFPERQKWVKHCRTFLVPVVYAQVRYRKRARLVRSGRSVMNT